MKRPRLTVRSMMLCVALVGLMLADLMTMRRDTYRERAASAAEAERHYRLSEAKLREAAMARPVNPAALGKAADLQHRRADWNAAKRARYQRAAEHPWFPIAPDLPEPK